MKTVNFQSTYYQTIIEKFNNLIINEISNRQLNIGFICQKLAMSKSKLYRIVKQFTGKSVKTIICEKRMENAILLLRSGNYTISEIAIKVGYNDISSFSKAFHRVVGEPPSKFILER